MFSGVQDATPDSPRRLTGAAQWLVAMGFVSIAVPASASIGLFGHGDGMKAMGMGGTSYSHAEEATALAGNPAHALALGHRLDIGLESLTPSSRVQFRGNGAGPDAEFTSTGRRFYPIPQGGYTRPISDRLAWGVSLLSAGLGPIYPQNPYERFGGGARSKLFLVSAGLVTAVSYRPHEDHTVGFGVTLGQQSLELTGLEFLAPLSEQPDKLTDQGKDSVFSVGFTLGWLMDLAPDLKLGLVYRSKAWTEKHEDYAGVLPEGGRLELPAIFGGGLTYTGLPDLTLSVEYQRYQYEDEAAFGNRVSQLAAGNMLGSADGPGFGIKNQNAYKFGVAWDAHTHLKLRAGYVAVSKSVRSSETLFGILGTLGATDVYSMGATFDSGSWELTSLVWYNPRDGVKGVNSIPPAFGGGEVDVSNELFGFGLSLGWKFGS